MSFSSAHVSVPAPAGSAFFATPSTRMPWLAMSRARASTSARSSAESGSALPSSSAVAHTWSTSSMAPFVIMSVRPAASPTTTLTRRRS